MSKSHDPKAIADRVNHVLQTSFAGNRSQMGNAIGFSHAAISRVVAGKKGAGPRMLAAIVERLVINRDWLLTGDGTPGIPRGADGVWKGGQPVFNEVVAGPILGHEGLSPDEWVNLAGLLNRTQYWLRLPGTSPLVKSHRHGFRSGDLILFDTDPDLIAKEHSFTRRLCVVTSPNQQASAIRLAYVEGGDDGLFDVDYVDTDIPASERVEEFTIRRWPGNEITASQRTLRVQPGQHKREEAVTDAIGLGPDDRPIKLSDVIAIWTGVLFRRRSQ